MQRLGAGEHSERPQTASIDKNVAQTYEVVLTDSRIMVRELAESMNIFTLQVYHITIQNIGMTSRPAFPAFDQTDIRTQISNALLAQLKRTKPHFYRQLIKIYLAGKVMATVFQNSYEVASIDYLGTGNRCRRVLRIIT